MGLLRRVRLDALYALWRSGPLREDGWFRSHHERRPVDARGNPIPWITYPALAFLASRVPRDVSVFEYGCGYGTLWWAARAREVVACDHDPAWISEIGARAPGHVTLLHVPLEYGGAYSRAAASYTERFDVVVIDGRDRVNCARHAVKALKPDGVIVWDNTERRQYREGLEHLASLGFRRIPFEGYAPIECHRCETSLLYRSENRLSL